LRRKLRSPRTGVRVDAPLIKLGHLLWLRD
jgi:hypothetical protein